MPTIAWQRNDKHGLMTVYRTGRIDYRRIEANRAPRPTLDGHLVQDGDRVQVYIRAGRKMPGMWTPGRLMVSQIGVSVAVAGKILEATGDLLLRWPTEYE